MVEFLRSILEAILKPTKISHNTILDYGDDKPLGHISKYFESGKSGPGTVSSGKGDPGGKSYGCHQLASKTGTLQAYLKSSKYGAELSEFTLASKAFDTKWKEIAKREPKAFELDQLAFIKRTHFDPVRSHANRLGLLNTRAINEALFSISVQHGGAKKVVSNAGITTYDSEITTIKKLYAARESYVRHIKSMPEGTRQSVLSRYKKEIRMVLELVGE